MSLHGKLFAVFLLVMASTPGFAQSFQGGLRGVVRDPAEPSFRGSMLLINEATNFARNTISNETGANSCSPLLPRVLTGWHDDAWLQDVRPFRHHDRHSTIHYT